MITPDNHPPTLDSSGVSPAVGDAAASEAGADPFDTALIARLANELFHGASASAITPAALNPGVPRAPAAPIVSTPSLLPPVHPRTIPETNAVTPHPNPPPLNETRSGAHAPGSEESYAFGEPRCYRRAEGPPPGSPAPTAGSSTAVNPGWGGLPGSSAATSSEFYFVREAPRNGGPTAGVESWLADSAVVPRQLSGFDVETLRRDFPALQQTVNGRPLVWLDNAATTHKPRAVIDATSQFYGRDNSNIHRAAHALAARATELYEGGREKVRQFLGAAETREIVFVRGTTEAINLVAQTYGRKHLGAGDEILLTTMEHHANIVPWQLLSEQTGAVIRVAPINDAGELILDQFATLLGPRTKLVAVTHVANALGTINPVEQIIALAHAYGVPVLVDGAQSSPHMPIHVQAMGADFFALSGHKIFGPTGIGVLYGRASLLETLPPWQGGGNMIQDVTFSRTVYQGIPQRFEAGTQDIAGVVGLGAAAEYLMGVGMPAIAAYEHELLVHATDALRSVPGLRLIGTAAAKASVLSFVIPGREPEKIGKHLDAQGIAVRSGHHCAQPALRRYGLQSTVRPSLAFYNTHDEIEQLAQALHAFVRR